MSETYLAKLRDPRWQKKRLEVMCRDGFACVECGDATTTLNVHHRRYVRGREPWEYAGDLLVTLCERCHEFFTKSDTCTMGEMFECVMRKRGFDSHDFARMMSVCGMVGELSEAQRKQVTEGFIALVLEATGRAHLQGKAREYSAEVEAALCKPWSEYEGARP